MPIRQPGRMQRREIVDRCGGIRAVVEQSHVQAHVLADGRRQVRIVGLEDDQKDKAAREEQRRAEREAKRKAEAERLARLGY